MSAPATSSGRRLAPRVALALGSALLALLVVEVVLRVQVARDFEQAHQPSLADALVRLQSPADGGPGRWLDVLRVMPDERIAYSLRPDFDGPVQTAGVTVRIATNSHGFRGPEWSVAKPPGTLRIVGLGDSVMMGFGIEGEQTYLHRLQEELNRAPDAARCETINLAVGGYNTVQEVATLRATGLALQPDLVLIDLVENDVNGIIYRGEPPDVLTLRRSFLFDWVVHPERMDGSGYAGWEAFSDALAELAALSRERGFEVLVISHREGPTVARMRQVAEGLGLQTLDLKAAVKQQARKRGVDPSLLSIPNDGHPSALHNELLAGILAAWLQTSGKALLDGKP